MNRHFTPFHHHYHIFMLLTWWPVLVAGFLSLELNLTLLLRQAFWKALHTGLPEQHRMTQWPLWKLCLFRAICSSHCLLHYSSIAKVNRAEKLELLWESCQAQCKHPSSPFSSWNETLWGKRERSTICFIYLLQSQLWKECGKKRTKRTGSILTSRNPSWSAQYSRVRTISSH